MLEELGCEHVLLDTSTMTRQPVYGIRRRRSERSRKSRRRSLIIEGNGPLD